MTVRNASCTLVDCSCSSATSAVSASIWASLVTWSGCLLGSSVLSRRGAQLLNVVGVLIQAGRIDDDSAAPSSCSGSRFGGRGAAGSARLGLAGLGQWSLARLLVPGIAADTAAPIRGNRVAWAFLTLVYHSATCGGRLGENFGDLGGRTAWAGRKTVEFSRDAPTGLDLRR